MKQGVLKMNKKLKESVKITDYIKELIEAHKEELERLKFEILQDPELIHTTKKFEIGVACLNDRERLDVINFIHRIDFEIHKCVVEEHYGYFEDVTGDKIPIHLEKKIEYDSLGHSMKHSKGTLTIESGFRYAYYEESKDYNGEITEEEYQIKSDPHYFNKISVQEWSILDPFFEDEEDDDYDDYYYYDSDDDDDDDNNKY